MKYKIFLTIVLLSFPSQGFVKKGKEAAVRSGSKNAQAYQQKISRRTSSSTNKFAQAQPEDITNQNFPDIVESFDYPNTEISEVVKAISRLTGKNFILDPGVSGKISIIAPTPITVAEAYRAFLSALAMNGLTVVPSGKFLKIRSVKFAKRDSLATYTGNYFPDFDQLITKIVKLKYISASELGTTLQALKSNDGEIVPYSPTNSLIITDYGSNVEKITNVLAHLDIPSFEEKLTVIPIIHAKSKTIADLIQKIIDQDSSGGRSTSRISRFSSRRTRTSKNSSSDSYSLVLSDDRSNSVIVVGNKSGTEKIKGLIKKLDFSIRPEDAGGVYVYYVKHGDAEKIAKVLNGVTEPPKESKETSRRTNRNRFFGSRDEGSKNNEGSQFFGGEVRVSSDKDTNSLIITAEKQDYELVLKILQKLDIQRDQVFVQAYVMEMGTSKRNSWGISYFKFDEDSNGIGRIGFGGASFADIINPAAGGGILSFGDSSTVNLQIPNGQGGFIESSVPSLLGFINLLKTREDTNILSAPQIMAIDNEEADPE